MTQQLIAQVAKQVTISPKQVQTVIELLQDGNTVPFIARYRKEATQSLDEVAIKAIEDSYQYALQLQERKEEVLRLIEEQGKLTEQLAKDINAATVLQRLEDLYRPYKQKRRTKATMAKEKGLESLATALLRFDNTPLEQLYAQYPAKEALSIDDALIGARDILAETFADDATIREKIRDIGRKRGIITTTLKKAEQDEQKVFEMYYDYSEPVHAIVPHRILAINRGEKEDVLRVSIVLPLENVLRTMYTKWIPATGNSPAIAEVKLAIEDAFKRLIQPSIERELRNELTEVAEQQAIHIFSENLRSLLLQPPMKNKYVLGVDPAFRTGCKLAVVDEFGKMIEIGVIYPHPPIKNKRQLAKEQVASLLQRYPIEIIAIGNGTASRETEQFIAEVLQQHQTNASYVIVNEAGASVYSASTIAREEFPELQVEERSAVSIARRLQDPLSELVKIEPKAVGVGQYQHDVSQKQLAESLSFVVETAVNQVGVDVNTASVSLLQHISGLSKTVAENIVKMRDENGPYQSRTALKKVPRLGAKTYEQAIGFLRVPAAKNPLDATGIHPESYHLAEALLAATNMTKKDLGTKALDEALSQLHVKQLAEQLHVGEITLKDIINVLRKPMRDPREAFPQPLLKTNVLKAEDLQVGMSLEGTVRNVVDFGAFVDIGVKQDGLVHISKLRKGRVKHPLDVVTLGDIVTVWVEQIDLTKNRVSLTMIPPNE